MTKQTKKVKAHGVPESRATGIGRLLTENWPLPESIEGEGPDAVGLDADNSTPEDWTPEEEQMFREASARGERRLAEGPLALSIEYDAPRKSLVIALSTGYSLLIPVHLLQGIPEDATEAQLANVCLLGPGGLGIEFTTLDAHFTLDGLIAGVYGSESWMAKLGRHGGLARTEAKAKASRENGKRGGRPRKQG